MVFKITLCEHNLNFGKTKQYAIRQIKLQNWTGKRNFAQSKNEKGGKKENQQKNGKGLAQQGLPCGNGSYNLEKDTNLQRKNENYISNRKM